MAGAQSSASLASMAMAELQREGEGKKAIAADARISRSSGELGHEP